MPDSNTEPQPVQFKSFWPIVIIASLSFIVGGIVVWVVFNQNISDDIASMVFSTQRQECGVKNNCGFPTTPGKTLRR